MKNRLTKLFTTFLAVVLLVGMSPAAASTAYAASWNSGTVASFNLGNWLKNWIGGSDKNDTDTDDKSETNNATTPTPNKVQAENDADEGGAADESGTADEINLTKTATDSGTDEDGNQIFDITLGVKGKQVSTARPIDITLVMDVSGSMNEQSKITDTKNAADDFVDAVLTEGSLARISVVKFSRNASAARFNSNNYQNYGTVLKEEYYGNKTTYDSYYSSNAAQVKKAIAALSASGGTNTEAGAVMAKRVTDSRNRSDAQSIVIFLTDGEPTYYSNGEVSKDGGSGNRCDNTCFDNAVSKFETLKNAGNQLYGIGFLTDYTVNSTEYNICEALLSDAVYNKANITYDKYGYRASFTVDTKKSANFTKYYGIKKGDNASQKIQSIYNDIYKIVNALASGTIVDRIPAGFKLTPESIDAINTNPNAEYDPTNNTVTYKNVEAGTELVTNTFTVKYEGNGYGAAYTNVDATYSGTLYDSSQFTKEFVKPVAGLHPKTKDDTDSTSVGTTITVDVKGNDNFEKLTVAGYEVSGYTIVLTDANGNPKTYDGDFTASIVNGKLQFTSSTAGTKELYYVVKANITKVGDNFAESGQTALVSRTTKVTINVYDTANQAFVVDFDKPVTYDADTVFSKSEQNATINLTNPTGTYGNMSLNPNKSITYTLKKFMDGIDKFIFSEKFSDKVTLEKSVSMIPATSVYYDDSFGSTEANSGRIVYSSNWEPITNKQANKELQDAAQGLDANYGYDSSYDDFIGNSNGTVHKVTADANGNVTATVKFTGTGIDVYALTNQTGGKVYAKLYSSDGKLKKSLLRDYSYLTGELFHVPVISFNGFAKDTYTLQLTIMKGSTFYLDGVRIYNPLGENIDQLPAEAKEAYKTDGELGSKLAYIRDGILKNSKIITDVQGTVYIDKYKTPDSTTGYVDGHNVTLGEDGVLAEYTRYGCKTETYLPAGKSLTLTLDKDYSNIQLGLKSSVIGATYTINGGSTRTINSSTDMYYKVTAQDNKITITNTSDAMIEITALKVVK